MINVKSLRTTVRVKNFFWKAEFCRFCCFFIFFTFHSSFFIHKTLAQGSFEFKHFQEKDGLSSNFVSCFLKDKDGLLWVGTHEGLNYYDGQRFVYFTKNREGENCLPNNLIYALAEDKNGCIWYGTRKGIGFYDKQTGTFENFTRIDGASIELVYNIYCDRAGLIWFSADNGLYCYDKIAKKFTLFKYQDTGKPSSWLFYVRRNGIVEDPHQYGLWLATDGGLVYLDIASKTFFHAFNNPKKSPIFKKGFASALALRGNAELIYGSDYHELTIIDVKTLTVKQKIALKSTRIPINQKISTIFVDSDQNIWVSTWAYTLFMIHAKTGEIQELSHDKNNAKSILGNFFWGVCQDDNQTIMFGTVNGISYTNPKRALYKVHNLSDKIPSLSQDSWISSLQEEADSWLVGTSTNGLFRFYPASKKVEKLTSDFPIWDLEKHNHGVFMVGSNGLMYYDLKTKSERMIPLPRSLSNELTDVEVENDSTVWVVGDSKYVALYNPYKKHFELFDLFANHPDKTTQRLGTQLLIDTHKDIWVFTSFHGFFKFSKSKKQFFHVKNSESVPFENLRTQPSFDSQNRFWLPNYGVGLYRYTPTDGRFKLWSRFEGLVSDFFTSTVVDNNGKVWAASFNKISIFEPQKESFQNLVIPVSEDMTDYRNKLHKLKNGHIISSIKGYLVELFPESVQPFKLTAKPLISQINISNHYAIHTNGKQAIKLAVGHNNITISFGYLPISLTAPYQFAFQLEGIDDDWRQEGTRSFASYSDLPGGDYVFKVKAIHGQYESEVSQLRLHIDTPFYQTTWFKVLAVLVLSLIVVAFIRYRANQRKRIHHLQLQSTRLEKDKTEIQYQNLINHLNPHFLFNSLTSLNSLIITEPKTASKFLQKLSAMYRYILQSKDKETVSLEEELNFVKNYVELQKSRFEEGLLIEIKMEDQYLAYGIVPVTLQNLFENAIKHNIIEDEKPLKIEVYVENEYLIVKNNLQKKKFVETSNKQGLDSLKKLYSYLTTKPFETIETENDFFVKVPLI